MTTDKAIAYSIFAVLLLACAAVSFIGYQQVMEDDPNFWQEVHAMQNDPVYQAQQQAENDALVEKTFPYAIGLVVVFVVLVFGGDVVRSMGRPLFILAVGVVLLGGIGYLFGFADKNNDGKQDAQTVMMVQPTGNDAANDQAYAEVNTTNADATMKNSASLVVIWIGFGIVVFLFGFVAQFFRSETL